ncbi:ABC transporter permease [Corynebacterium durum]|uniref:ABC transporter permease n=1 Tax=Corynebacterium durum TaxID=61592 RepID=UPI0028E9B031|nr:ABC transporter permease [Corynebacterium durum]
MSTLRYISFDIRRALKEPTALAVSIALPSVLFIVFGASQTGTDRAFNDGNVAAYVMIGMAAYGAITGAVGTVGNMVIDEISGWGRQLALTPLRAWQRTVAQIVTTMARAALAVIGVFLCGYFGNASMPVREWLAAGALSVVAVIPFSLYGLVFASAFRSSAAVSLASLSIVPLAFVGNAFAPMPESFMPFARFSPIYGSVSLARYPLSDGIQAISSDPYTVDDPLWYALVNIAAWTLIFALICTLLWRRDKGR